MQTTRPGKIRYAVYAATVAGAYCLSSNHAGERPEVTMAGTGWVFELLVPNPEQDFYVLAQCVIGSEMPL